MFVFDSKPVSLPMFTICTWLKKEKNIPASALPTMKIRLVNVIKDLLYLLGGVLYHYH